MSTAVKRSAASQEEDNTKNSKTQTPESNKKPKKDASITSFFGGPKTAAPSSSPSSAVDGATNGTLKNSVTPAKPKFDKEAWIAKLTDEQKELLKLEIETLDESWLPHLAEELTSKSFLELKSFLKKEKESGKKVFPPEGEVYSWSRHTPLHTVKAVIIGQDPYHNLNQAHGLCFSVRPPTPAPPSLGNIYKALTNDYPSFTPPPKRGGLLTPWADRGVLLLNTSLTVEAHKPNSHSGKGWEKLTQKVIDVVNRTRTRGVVFLAWGNSAKGRCKGVNGQRHLVLTSVHPSPYSAANGFFECGHFKKTNQWLKDRYGEDGEINWDLNVPPEEAGV